MVVSFNSNATGDLKGTGTVNPSRAPEFVTGFQWCSCCSSFIFLCSVLQIVVCPFVLFSFGHCIVCPSSILDFRLPFWASSISSWIIRFHVHIYPYPFLLIYECLPSIYFNSCLLFNCSDFMALTKENAAYVVILMTQYHVKTRLMGNMRMGLLCADTGSTRNL